MATRLTPYTAGESVTVRGPRGGALSVTAPDGLGLTIPAANGSATVWLAQAGTWRFEWSDGSSGEWRVIATVEDASADVGGIVEPG